MDILDRNHSRRYRDPFTKTSYGAQQVVGREYDITCQDNTVIRTTLCWSDGRVAFVSPEINIPIYWLEPPIT